MYYSRQQNCEESGFSLIELIIVILVIGIIAAIAIPNLLKARRSANEASAVSSISILHRAQHTYRNSQGNGEFVDLPGLRAADYIDVVIGTAPHRKSGYEFQIDVYASTPSIAARFDLRGRPIIHALTSATSGTGSRDFGSNEVGGIYETLDNTAVSFDPVSRIAQGTAVPIDR